MTKTVALNRLFEEWKQQRPEEAQRMCLDGIIHEERYENTNPKILFIMKEPNHPEGPGFDFREWWGNEGARYAFSIRLCEWTYGIWNGFPPLAQFDAEADTSDIIRSIAFMNLKKVGGGSQADSDVIRSTTVRDEDFLRQQIAIINPNVIVGGVGDSSLWSVLFPGIVFQPSGFDIGVARVGHLRIIDFYHPSYRIPRAMSYCLLGRVFGRRLTTVGQQD